LNEKISAYRYRETRYVETIESKDSEISSLQNDIRKLKRLQKQNESKTKQVRESLSKKLQITKNKSNEESNRYESIIESLRSKNDSLQSDLINKSNDFNNGLSRKETELSNLQERLNKSNDRIAYLENQLESVSKAHESDIKSIDSEVEDYTRLLSEAKDKIDNGNATIKELKESLNNANKALQSTKSINLTLSDGLKKFQESYLSKVSKAVGIDARALSSSVTRDTTPDQIDSLVEAMRDRIDRHNRVGISKNGIDVDKDYIVNTTKDDSADALENNRLISFLQSAQGSL
jgi:chromosome segregation ATPase